VLSLPSHRWSGSHLYFPRPLCCPPWEEPLLQEHLEDSVSCSVPGSPRGLTKSHAYQYTYLCCPDQLLHLTPRPLTNCPGKHCILDCSQLGMGMQCGKSHLPTWINLGCLTRESGLCDGPQAPAQPSTSCLTLQTTLANSALLLLKPQ
jgi:hypothetical protein